MRIVLIDRSDVGAERSWTAFAGVQFEAALRSVVDRADRLTTDAKQII